MVQCMADSGLIAAMETPHFVSPFFQEDIRGILFDAFKSCCWSEKVHLLVVRGYSPFILVASDYATMLAGLGLGLRCRGRIHCS